MKRFHYLFLGQASVFSSDSETLHALYEEVRKHVPSCRVKHETYDFNGELESYQLNKIPNVKYDKVCRYLPKVLVGFGWELIQVNFAGVHYSNSYYFKKEYEE